MNIFKFEIKNNLKFILYWVVAICLLSLLYISFYPMLEGELSSFEKIMSNYPDAIVKALGFDAKLITSLTGYYATFVLNFVILFSTICSSILGFSIIAKDLTFKRTEFLYTKPVKREEIILSKITSGLFLLLIFNIIFAIFNFSILIFMGELKLKVFLLSTFVIFLMQVIFYSISLIVSVFLKSKTNVGSGISLVFLFYILGFALSNDFRIFIPFKYYDMNYIINNLSYEYEFIVINLIIFISAIVFNIMFYRKGDL